MLGLSVGASAASGYVATITPLGAPFEPTAVSRDGAVVAGTPGFRWQSDTGVRLLQAPPTYGEPTPSCLSQSGSIIVGSTRNTTWGLIASVWDATGAVVTSPWRGLATGCSHDAQIAVGSTVSGQYGHGPGVAVRWTSVDGVQSLPTPVGTAASGAVGVSGDGAVTVGWFQRAGQEWRAARWLGAGDFLELWLPPGCTQSQPSAVSDDGTVIVGFAWVGNTMGGIRWSADGSGDWFPGGFVPKGVNHDGSVIVGTAYNVNGGIATRWTAAAGSRNLLEYLAAKGANLNGWSSLLTAVAVSADGKVIVGCGTYNGQQHTGFVAFAPLECPGDLFVDGQVNGADLGVLLSQWGPASQSTTSDIDTDGVVNGADLGLLLSNWGSCP